MMKQVIFKGKVAFSKESTATIFVLLIFHLDETASDILTIVSILLLFGYTIEQYSNYNCEPP